MCYCGVTMKMHEGLDGGKLRVWEKGSSVVQSSAPLGWDLILVTVRLEPSASLKAGGL